MVFCIYVTFHSCGKYYVGKGKTLLVQRGLYKGSGIALKKAFKKFPMDEWVTEVVKAGLEEQEAYDLEAFYVDENLIQDPMCLNLRGGGRTAAFYSAESKAKMSRVAKLRVPSEETKSKTRASLQGRMTNPRSSEIAFEMGKKNFGKKHTETSKANMVASRIGKKRGPYKISLVKSEAQLEYYRRMSSALTGKKRGPYAKRVPKDPLILSH